MGHQTVDEYFDIEHLCSGLKAEDDPGKSHLFEQSEQLVGYLHVNFQLC